MRLKNYQEDIVLRAIDIALEDETELRSDDAFVYDVAAYVLNRIPPKYLMSERGFLRHAVEQLGEASSERTLANIIELMLLVNRGVDLVRDRRPRHHDEKSGRISPEPAADFVHNFPQFIGRVIDVTGEPVYGAVVSLTMDGEWLTPAEPGWKNPYTTYPQTKGYFSFWPRAMTREAELFENKLTLAIDHPDFESLMHTEVLNTSGAYQQVETIYADDVINLGNLELARDK